MGTVTAQTLKEFPTVLIFHCHYHISHTHPLHDLKGPNLEWMPEKMKVSVSSYLILAINGFDMLCILIFHYHHHHHDLYHPLLPVFNAIFEIAVVFSFSLSECILPSPWSRQCRLHQGTGHRRECGEILYLAMSILRDSYLFRTELSAFQVKYWWTECLMH